MDSAAPSTGLPGAATPPSSAWPYTAFIGYEPAPTYAPPPADQAQLDRINLLVKHCVSNGPAFLTTVNDRQAADPAFAFLVGGDGSDYFKWALYAATLGAPADQPAAVQQAAAAAYAASLVQQASAAAAAAAGRMQQQQAGSTAAAAAQQPASTPAATATASSSSSMQLSAELEASFGLVLDALTGSKDSIKAAQQWFMACGTAAAAGLARVMAVRACAASTAQEKKLHIIYLANDILFKGLGSRPAGGGPGSDSIAAALQPVMAPVLAAAYVAGGRTEEIKTRLTKILTFWGERQVFSQDAINAMTNGMTSIDNPTATLAQALAVNAAATAAARAAAAAAAAVAVPGQATSTHQQQSTPFPGQPHQGAAFPPPGAPPGQWPGGPAPPGMPYPGQQGAPGQWPGMPPYPGVPPGFPPGGPMMMGVGGVPPPHHGLMAPGAAGQGAGMMMMDPNMAAAAAGGWPHGMPPPHMMMQGMGYPHQGPPGMMMGPGGWPMGPPSGPGGAMLPPPPDLLIHSAAPGPAGPMVRAAEGGHHDDDRGRSSRRRWKSRSRSSSRGRRRSRSSSGSSRSSGSSSSSRSRSRGRRRSSSSSRSRSPGSRSRAHRVSRFHATAAAISGLPPRDLAASPPRGGAAGAAAAGGGGPPTEPVSSFNFPPGMLPALCTQRKASGAQLYEPLMAEEIEAMGFPPPPVKDDYLASRLEKFFAEVRDYRPGLNRADIEDPSHSWHRQRLRQEYEKDPEGLRQRWWRGGGRRAQGGRGEPGKVHADGTFTGSGNMYAGLGAHVADGAKMSGGDDGDTLMMGGGGLGLGAGGGAGAGGGDATVPAGLGAAAPATSDGPPSFEDMYNSYRNSRSGGYHAMIMANAARAQMNSVVPRRKGRPLG